MPSDKQTPIVIHDASLGKGPSFRGRVRGVSKANHFVVVCIPPRAPKQKG